MITQEEHEEAAKKIVDLVQKKLPGYYRTPVSQIQCSEDGCRRESMKRFLINITEHTAWL